MFLLTVAIPTFNEEKVIKQNLENIHNIDFNEFQIEIIVSDNNSTDRTGEIVKKFSKIKYYKNNTNIGFGLNCNKIVNLAKGKFVWLLSSNDLINIKYFKDIYYFLENNTNLDVLFINYKEKYKEKFIICDSGNKFFDVTDFRSGLISSNIINKNQWKKIFVNLKKNHLAIEDWGSYYAGRRQILDITKPPIPTNNWIQFEYLIRVFEKKNVKAGVFLGQGIIDIPMDKSSWGHNGTFIYYGFEIVNLFKTMSLRFYSEKIKEKAISTIKKGYPKNLITAKISGLKTDKLFNKTFIDTFNINFIEKFIYIPLLLIPKEFFIFFFKIYFINRRLIKFLYLKLFKKIQ